MKRVIVTSVLVGVSFALGARAEEGNLVSNPSFTKASEGWPDDRFFVIQMPVEGVRDTARGHSDKACYTISAKKEGKGFLHSTAFDVKPKTRYDLSCWIQEIGRAHV